MSWTDRKAIEIIKQLRDKFKVKEFVETGTFMGVNAKLHSSNFDRVYTCEINPEYIKACKKKFKGTKNIFLLKKSSPRFLQIYSTAYDYDERKDYVIIYLDAHFYDPKLKNKWVVQEELKSLIKFKNCIIIIHDFDNKKFGHCTYEDEALGMKVVKELLLKVNPKFKFYTNTVCDIVKRNEIVESGLENDKQTIDNIKYAWSKKDKGKRGILYCLPKEIKLKGIRRLK